MKLKESYEENISNIQNSWLGQVNRIWEALKEDENGKLISLKLNKKQKLYNYINIPLFYEAIQKEIL